MAFIAHITEIDGEKKIQTVKEHSYSTCKYALEVMENCNFQNLIKVSALLHDMGKCKSEFTEYIEDAFSGKDVRRGEVNHTFAGVIYILEKYHTTQNINLKIASEIIAYAIGAHHGLFDCIVVDGKHNYNDFIHRLKKDKNEISYFESRDNFFTEVISENEIERLVMLSADEIAVFLQKLNEEYLSSNKGQEISFSLSMLSRFVLSCVIYGDRKDTELFMNGEISNSHKADWEKESLYFESKVKEFKADSPINAERKRISDLCKAKATDKPDIYRLNVPTGGGKTLSSLRYGISHNNVYNKNRVIFIIPLLSIIDQNSKIIKDYVQNPDSVLEYHSNIVRDDENYDKWKYVSDRWENIYVISTLVQFLNILFSGKTTDIARMKSFYNATIVIDEVQSLPLKLTYMFNDALNFLRDFCNTTIILSSATQPTLPDDKHIINEKKDNDVVKLTDEEKQVFKRSDIKICNNMTIESTADLCKNIIENSSSLLVICNKKKQALELFDILKENDTSSHFYHLSTSMCSSHRLNVISKICDDLKVVQTNQDNSPFKVVCISTQLVEAGVDFSFQNVVRIAAGIDNLAQSAGRCNRGNEYSGRCNVYSVVLENENLAHLNDIYSAKQSSLALYQKFGEEDILGEDAIRQYYKIFYRKTEEDLSFPIKTDYYANKYNLFGLLTTQHLKNGNSKAGFALSRPFKTIGEKFSVFEDNTISAIVPFGEGTEIIEQLRNTAAYDYELIKALVNKAKSYTVSLYKWQEEKLFASGMLEYLFDGKICVLNDMTYDNIKGLVMNEFNTEDMII